MVAQKGLTCSLVENLLNSNSVDSFNISDDKSENSYSNVTDSDGRDESSNNSGDSERNISTPPVQKKQEVNEVKGQQNYICLHHKSAQHLIIIYCTI
jgi:hypothetical protein